MAVVDKTAASLRFFGDDLDPDELTAILGVQPTRARKKGCRWFTPKGREMAAPARDGAWILNAPECQPGDLDRQIAELLGAITADLGVWNDLTTRFRADIFSGLFMCEGNEGESLSAKTMMDLGARGLSLGLDIYGPREPD